MADGGAQLTFRLPPEMLEQLRELAREDERSLSQMARLLLGRELARIQAEKGRKRT